MPLDNALEATALADADDVHKLLAFENIDQNAFASLHRACRPSRLFFDLDRNFAQKFTGGRLCLPKCPRIGLVSLDSFTNSTSPICAAS